MTHPRRHGLRPTEQAPEPAISPDDGGLNLEATAARGAAWIAVEMMSVQGMSLVVFATLAHFLTTTDFGLVGICFVVLQSAKTVLLDQAANAITRKKSATSSQYSTVFWITVTLGILGFIGIEIFSLRSDWLFHTSGLRPVLQAMGVIFLTMAIARTQEVWLVRHFRFKVLAMRSIVAAVLGGLAGVVCAVLHLGVWSLVVQQVTTTTCAFSLLWWTCPWRPSFVFSRNTAAEIALYYRAISGNVLLTIVNQNFDTVAIAMCFGSSSVGIYTIGKRLKLAIQMVASTPITGVIMPAMAEAGDPKRLREIILRATTAAVLICGPVFIGSAAVSHDAIRLFFGPKWAAAGPVFAWLAIGGLFSLLVDYNNLAFTVLNKVTWTTYISLLYTLLAVAAFAISAHLHVTDIATPFVVPFAIILPVSVGLLIRSTGMEVKQWAAACLPVASICIVMFFAVRFAASVMSGLSSPARLACLCLLGAAVYGALVGVLLPSVVRSAMLLVGRRRLPSIIRFRTLRRA